MPLNATAPFHKCGAKSPFPHLPFKTGAMHFRFMQVRGCQLLDALAKAMNKRETSHGHQELTEAPEPTTKLACRALVTGLGTGSVASAKVFCHLLLAG